MNYNSQSFEIRQTEEFQSWLAGLSDVRAQERINKRIAQLEGGLLGDVKFFLGIGEVRIDCGPKYRLYFVRRDKVLIVLLYGGDKSTQRRDIERAAIMAKDI